MKLTNVNMLCNHSMRQCNAGPVTKITIKTPGGLKFLQMNVKSLRPCNCQHGSSVLSNRQKCKKSNQILNKTSGALLLSRILSRCGFKNAVDGSDSKYREGSKKQAWVQLSDKQKKIYM